MSQDLLADREARRVAQTVFDRPLLVEAGAGTGKTTTLVARVLAWCLGSGWERAAARLDDQPLHKVAAEVLQGVVAITFTEAAAAEMASRVAESFALVAAGREEAIRGYTPSRDTAVVETYRLRAGYLLETFDHLTVSTIHAFCYALLTDYPLEARLHPELRVDADGSELEALARNAVERFTQQAYSHEDASPFLELAARGIGPGEILEATTHWMAIGAPAALLEEDPLTPARVSSLATGLAASVDELLDLIGDRFRSLPTGRVAVGVREALVATQELPETASDTQAMATRLRLLWPDGLLKKLKEWGKRRFTKEEEADLEDLTEAVAKSAPVLEQALRHFTRLDPVFLTAARQALLPVVRQIERELRTRGVITFSGLLRETRRLLREAPTVLERLRQRLDLVLVDEFQDTDPIQSEIVRRLSLEGEADACPSLFVVGDPKQSIYGWRDADLAAYEEFERTLLERGGERHSLTVNFRSAQALLDEVECVIAPVMNHEPGLQPPFRGLQAAQPAEPEPFREGSWREVEYWVSWQPDPETGRLAPGTLGQSRRIEARELAEDVRSLHEHAGVAWSDIAILFRKSAPQPTFLDELRRVGVPFAVTRDRNYYQRREVIDAAAWIRAIVNPADHLALLTILRTVIVGVPDAALLPLWTRSFPKLVTELRSPDEERLAALRRCIADASEALPDGVPGLERITGWEDALQAALESLARLRLSYRRDPADLFVANVRSELLLEASEAARFQGKFRLANLHRFFGQLQEALESDEAGVHAILRALRLGVVQTREAEEAMPRDAVEEAVQIMTIHTAKGLEFEHVYLVQMHSGTRSGSQEAVEARELAPDDWEYRLFGAGTPTFQRAEERQRGIEAAEAVRTLYVAMTRASRRLVLVGSWPEDPTPGHDPFANYLDMLRHRDGLPRSLGELANDPTVQLRGGYHDQAGIRWRFLGGRQSLGTRRRRPESSDWLPDAERLARIADARAVRANEVAAHQNRPLLEPVTAVVPEHLEEAAPALLANGALATAPPLGERNDVLALGTALHRCLESWNLDAPPTTELERQLECLPVYFPFEPEGELIAEARLRLERISRGRLLERLFTLRDRIVARELPLLATPDTVANEGIASGPVAGLVGSIDLLYRDPVTEELVVADFKTDRLESDEQIAARAPAYARQEERYARAVQEALLLDRPPRTELWLLWPDRIWSSTRGAG
jgi:ATP-dependent helicase/nuclease subunit A